MPSTHLKLQIASCVTAKFTLLGKKKKVRLVQIFCEKQQQSISIYKKATLFSFKKKHKKQNHKSYTHFAKTSLNIYPHLYSRIESLPKNLPYLRNCVLKKSTMCRNVLTSILTVQEESDSRIAKGN